MSVAKGAVGKGVEGVSVEGASVEGARAEGVGAKGVGAGAAKRACTTDATAKRPKAQRGTRGAHGSSRASGKRVEVPAGAAAGSSVTVPAKRGRCDVPPPQPQAQALAQAQQPQPQQPQQPQPQAQAQQPQPQQPQRPQPQAQQPQQQPQPQQPQQPQPQPQPQQPPPTWGGDVTDTMLDALPHSPSRGRAPPPLLAPRSVASSWDYSHTADRMALQAPAEGAASSGSRCPVEEVCIGRMGTAEVDELTKRAVCEMLTRRAGKLHDVVGNGTCWMYAAMGAMGILGHAWAVSSVYDQRTNPTRRPTPRDTFCSEALLADTHP